MTKLKIPRVDGWTGGRVDGWTGIGTLRGPRGPKKELYRKILEIPNICYILESWGFKDVKYDIPMCQSHSTRPQPIQLVPAIAKKNFPLLTSLGGIFWEKCETCGKLRNHLLRPKIEI